MKFCALFTGRKLFNLFIFVCYTSAALLLDRSCSMPASKAVKSRYIVFICTCWHMSTHPSVCRVCTGRYMYICRRECNVQWACKWANVLAQKCPGPKDKLQCAAKGQLQQSLAFMQWKDEKKKKLFVSCLHEIKEWRHAGRIRNLLVCWHLSCIVTQAINRTLANDWPGLFWPGLAWHGLLGEHQQIYI